MSFLIDLLYTPLFAGRETSKQRAAREARHWKHENQKNLNQIRNEAAVFRQAHAKKMAIEQPKIDRLNNEFKEIVNEVYHYNRDYMWYIQRDTGRKVREMELHVHCSSSPALALRYLGLLTEDGYDTFVSRQAHMHRYLYRLLERLSKTAAPVTEDPYEFDYKDLRFSASKEALSIRWQGDVDIYRDGEWCGEGVQDKVRPIIVALDAHCVDMEAAQAVVATECEKLKEALALIDAKREAKQAKQALADAEQAKTRQQEKIVCFLKEDMVE